MLQAGLYQRQSVPVYMGVKMVLLFTPWFVGMALGLSGLAAGVYCVTGGAICSAVGLVGPEAWLDRAISRRWSALRAGLYDVLDVLVLCMEAGQSLPAAFQLVTTELRSSHSALGFELRIVQREIQLGCSLSQSLRNLADRCGLEEIGILASTVDQTERLGASLVRALRIQAEQLRFRRTQTAEERAQKAGGKILFPTLLFIFPCIFVTLLGPAAIQVQEVLAKRNAAVLDDPMQKASSPGPVK